MRLLKPVYLYLATPGEVVPKDRFASMFSRATIGDGEFNTDNFKPGTSGETALYRRLLEEMNL